MEDYDKRHGWRGPVANVSEKNWLKETQEFKIDKSLSWKLAKIINIDKLSVKIETENKEIGFIYFENVSWTRKKKF